MQWYTNRTSPWSQLHLQNYWILVNIFRPNVCCCDFSNMEFPKYSWRSAESLNLFENVIVEPALPFQRGARTLWAVLSPALKILELENEKKYFQSTLLWYSKRKWHVTTSEGLFGKDLGFGSTTSRICDEGPTFMPYVPKMSFWKIYILVHGLIVWMELFENVSMKKVAQKRFENVPDVLAETLTGS